MNSTDTIQAGYLIELEKLRKENAGLKAERMALRNKAISEGMTLLSAEEITGEGMASDDPDWRAGWVLVRREDLELVLSIPWDREYPYVEGETGASDRLHAALDQGQEIPEPEE